jgi:hypothetical protein
VVDQLIVARHSGERPDALFVLEDFLVAQRPVTGGGNQAMFIVDLVSERHLFLPNLSRATSQENRTFSVPLQPPPSDTLVPPPGSPRPPSWWREGPRPTRLVCHGSGVSAHHDETSS